MFERIHFARNFSSLELTSKEVLKNVPTNENGRIAEQYSTADFHISGTVRALQSYPITEKNKENYLFLQNFNYMNADETYYSRQQNYRSYQLLYTYSGEALMTYQKKQYRLMPGTVFLADCTSTRSVKTTGRNWECSDLHFYGGKSQLLYETWLARKNPVFTIQNPARFQTLLEDALLRHTTVSPYREWSVSSALESLLLFNIEADTSADSRIPERIQYLITYMENNYAQPLTLDALADFAGLSKYHLSREFKKFTGYSPYAYLTELRFDRAKSMLLHPPLPSYQIARLTRFRDESNFIKLFKQRTEMTPGEFRNGEHF